MTAPLIAIYGAYGHTGRLVAAELLERGRRIVLSGRDATALDDLAAHLRTTLDDPARVHVHPAALDDTAALHELTSNARVLVHCAGPFSQTGGPLATAATATGCHYIDHAIEAHHVKRLFDAHAGPARDAGIVMIPGLSFYGGLGDLLASAVAHRRHAPGGTAPAERIIVGYAVSGWRLTTGAKNTAAQLFAETERITFTGGALHTGYLEPRNAVFPFPPPLGPRTMIAPLPSFETITIPRHVPTRNVDLMLTAATFQEDGAFDSEDADADTRAATDFTVAVQAVAPEGPGASGHLTGRDLWRAAALASVEAAVRIADGQGPTATGVLSPAEAFPAAPFLRDLEDLGAFTLHLPAAAADGNG
ncbi:saccharopine dehydrogenase NADP-binding domain-containing protein [Actinomadura rugatobispora]|uniref:Saccharopine dehydrogenase NADP-binding domain-containing protein n=1 Tax=Actinomadura rugatobispora TaxID=1994 RepID=A0ABW0ZZ53_9ACTN|nr:saccharopine dehydrogenase NADP-binding domain-containing protein [Actinomadura rugatobispora]